MPKINMVLPHRVSQEEAMTWARELLTEVGNKPENKVDDVNISWNHHSGTFQFKAMELSASGTIVIEPTCVKIAAELPLAASLLKSKIESTIRERAVRLLA